MRVLRMVLVYLVLVAAVNFGLMGTVDAQLLQSGMRGEEIRGLQKALVTLGSDLAVDGIFGAQTKEAVVQVQALVGIATDGIVGPETVAALQVLQDSVVPYIVRSGDTLSGLAFAYGTTVNQIMRRNSLDNPNQLYAGQRLLIPNISQVVFSRGRPRPMFSWPLNGEISSPYGWRNHPISSARHFHGGIDIAAAHGATVRAAAGGKVVTAGSMGAYGLAVVIDHGLGHTTWYGHLSKIVVRVGDTVQAGEQIARVGSTGVSTGPHLDFRVKIGENTINPLEVLP